MSFRVSHHGELLDEADWPDTKELNASEPPPEIPREEKYPREKQPKPINRFPTQLPPRHIYFKHLSNPIHRNHVKFQIIIISAFKVL
jgi:hypothetical protein